MAASFRIILDSPTTTPGSTVSGRIEAITAVNASQIKLALFGTNLRSDLYSSGTFGVGQYTAIELHQSLRPGQWIPFLFSIPNDIVPGFETTRINLNWHLIGRQVGKFTQAPAYADLQILPPGPGLPLRQRITKQTKRRMGRRHFQQDGWSHRQRHFKDVDLALTTDMILAGTDIEAQISNVSSTLCVVGLLCHEWREEPGAENGTDPVHALIFESWQPLTTQDQRVLLAVPPAGPPSYEFGRSGVRWEVRISFDGNGDKRDTHGPVQEAFVFI